MGVHQDQLTIAPTPSFTTMARVTTRSGLTIDPISSVTDLLAGTSFSQDKVAQEHLKSLGDAFHDIWKTKEGQTMLAAMEGLAGQIKSESNFKDAVKVCFRLAKKITGNPWVQFGLFIGLFGVAAVFSTGMSQVMRSLGTFIITSTLMPIGHGVKQSVDGFMGGGEDVLDTRTGRRNSQAG